MKGYKKFNIEAYIPVEENTLVGCTRCRETWRELTTHHNGVRINGPLYKYDYCDKCITPEEKSHEIANGRFDPGGPDETVELTSIDGKINKIIKIPRNESCAHAHVDLETAVQPTIKTDRNGWIDWEKSIFSNVTTLKGKCKGCGESLKAKWEICNE